MLAAILEGFTQTDVQPCIGTYTAVWVHDNKVWSDVVQVDCSGRHFAYNEEDDDFTQLWFKPKYPFMHIVYLVHED